MNSNLIILHLSLIDGIGTSNIKSILETNFQ